MPRLDPNDIGNLEDRLESHFLLADADIISPAAALAASSDSTDGVDIAAGKAHLVASNEQESALVLDSQSRGTFYVVGIVGVLQQLVQKVGGFGVEFLRHYFATELGARVEGVNGAGIN